MQSTPASIAAMNIASRSPATTTGRWELGTARMGEDPKTSVLNKYCQAHDVNNVFVTDAAAFVTNPDKNPTLTIMALSWRASEYLIDQARKGSL